MRKFGPVVAGVLMSAILVALTGCGKNPEQDTPSEMGSETESTTGTDSETELETSTEQGTSTELETGTEDITTPDVPGYTFTDLDKDMWTLSNLNVRDLPNTDGVKLAQLSQGQQVHVTGQCNETSWYRIEYDGGVGYVSNNYLSEEKPGGIDTPDTETRNPTTDALKDVSGKDVNKVGTIYVMGNAAFESYEYNDNRGTTYAELITKVADSLQGVSSVYCMPIPLSSGVVMPEEYESKVSVGNQETAIDSVLGHMGTNVVEVDIFGTLEAHREEYLYFRTDHHWTQLGAYYAYTEFCKAKGITAHNLDEYKHVAYTDFVGSFYFSHYENNKNTVLPLKNAPDTVYTYEPISNAKMTVTNSDGATFAWPIIKDVSKYKTGVKYSCFIAGDNPYTVIENKDITDGSSCVVIKESYGNAFVPFLVDHYQTVYVIDQRYWEGNLIDFAKTNNVNDVIFANNLTAIGSKSQLANFRGIIE